MKSSSRSVSGGPPCEGSIPRACAQVFSEIAAQCCGLSTGQEALHAKLDTVAKAVLGNGTTKDSLLARVERLETSKETILQYGDRFWKVFAVLLALASVVIAILK